MSLKDGDGMPWSTHLDWTWMIFLALFSGGIAIIALALDQAFWTYRKGKSSFPFFAYLCIVLTTVIAGVLSHTWFVAKPVLFSAFGDVILVLFVGLSFVLRQQILSLFSDTQAIAPSISPYWTLLFSNFYINLCLRRAQSPALKHSEN